MNAQISLTHVSKTFVQDNNRINAIDDLSLEVQRGEFVGYAGPNGAGKSTSIKAMTGLLAVSSGEVRVRGVDPLRKRRHLALHVGVVFGQRSQMLWELSSSSFFEMLKALYRIPDRKYRSQLERITTAMELGEFIDQPVRSLSLGQRMRCELASALLVEPEILFLDEPTIGLDVDAKAAIRETLREINEENGTTILLTTHDLTDIEALCSRLMIIDHGKLAYDGTIEGLITTHSPEASIEFHLTKQADLELDPTWTAELRGTTLRVVFNRRQATAAAVIQSVLSRVDVIDLKIVEPAIEDVIREIYASSRKPA